jgi:hypothetical protein
MPYKSDHYYSAMEHIAGKTEAVHSKYHIKG